MEKTNKVARIAHTIGRFSFVIMMVCTFICVAIVVAMIADGDEDEALMFLPWVCGVLVGGFAETGICFVISEIVQLLDNSSKYLAECVHYLRKGNNKASTEKIYNEELPEL